jgi:peptidyl-prolyl cis-trans isomerase B (cyclophilin B)
MKKLLLLSLLFLSTVGFTIAQKQPKFDSLVVLTTDLGEITLLLYGDTPLHRANFLKLAGD